MNFDRCTSRARRRRRRLDGHAQAAPVTGRRSTVSVKIMAKRRLRDDIYIFMFRRNAMTKTARRVLLTAAVLIPLAVHAQPRPGNPTTATVITKAEIDKISATEQSQRTRDENA